MPRFCTAHLKTEGGFEFSSSDLVSRPLPSRTTERETLAKRVAPDSSFRGCRLQLCFRHECLGPSCLCGRALRLCVDNDADHRARKSVFEISTAFPPILVDKGVPVGEFAKRRVRPSWRRPFGSSGRLLDALLVLVLIRIVACQLSVKSYWPATTETRHGSRCGILLQRTCLHFLVHREEAARKNSRESCVRRCANAQHLPKRTLIQPLSWKERLSI